MINKKVRLDIIVFKVIPNKNEKMDDTGRFFILMPQALFDFEDLISLLICKVGCVVVMVVVSILPHAEFGPNDHRKDAPPFTNNISLYCYFFNFLNNFEFLKIGFS